MRIKWHMCVFFSTVAFIWVDSSFFFFWLRQQKCVASISHHHTSLTVQLFVQRNWCGRLPIFHKDVFFVCATVTNFCCCCCCCCVFHTCNALCGRIEEIWGTIPYILSENCENCVKHQLIWCMQFGYWKSYMKMLKIDTIEWQYDFCGKND